MITKSKQNWEVGQTVKVGFMSLVVAAKIATPYDFAPDAYLLTNHAGTQLYKFVPHNGCEKITPLEAKSLVASQTFAAHQLTAAVLQKARDDARRATEVLSALA